MNRIMERVGDGQMNIYMGNSNYIKKRPIKGNLIIEGKKISIGKSQADDNEKINAKESSTNEEVISIGQKKDPIAQKEEALKKALEQFLIGGEDTEERYQSVLDKVKNGEYLTTQDLEYIKKRDPDLYNEVQTEIRMAKQLEERLRYCNFKEEAKDIYIKTMHKAGKLCGIKGNTTTKPNIERYNRLMKRINKVWDKYQKGELGKKKDENELEKENEEKLLKRKIKVFEQFQLIDEDEIYNEQS